MPLTISQRAAVLRSSLDDTETQLKRVWMEMPASETERVADAIERTLRLCREGELSPAMRLMALFAEYGLRSIGQQIAQDAADLVTEERIAQRRRAARRVWEDEGDHAHE